MSARPTSADVLRVIGNDDDMRDAARVAAVLARESWQGDMTRPNAPTAVVGGYVRAVLPEWLEDALGDDDDATIEIGQGLYPRFHGHVTDAHTLDALPVGALLVDRDGYVLVKESWERPSAPPGDAASGTEYRVLYSPDSAERGAVFAADEIAGDYAEPGTGSSFLPGRAYMIGGAR